MRKRVLPVMICGVAAMAVFGAEAQNPPVQGVAQGQPAPPGTAPGQLPPGQQPKADPYANNATPGTQTFPLAAPAGKDSNAKMVAPPGATNQGSFTPAGWKYGTVFNPPAGAKIWNPVKLKMMQGGKVTGGTLFSATDPATYCAMANAGYDFIWTEMQHDQRDWENAARMWRTCPFARAVAAAPGAPGRPASDNGGSSSRMSGAIGRPSTGGSGSTTWSATQSDSKPAASAARPSRAAASG